jgi:hypothetical protein
MTSIEIIWREDPLKFTYLREDTYLTTAPVRFPVSRPIFYNQSKIVGYEVVRRKRSEKSPRVYRRRFWYLKKHDRDIDPNGVYKYSHPTEAVDPPSICLGEESIPYERSAAFQDDVERLRKDRGI